MRALRVQVYDSETKRTRNERYTRSPVHIGRHPSNELCLSFGFVSSRHAQLNFDERGGTFRDLGSTNGSVVGGRRVNAHETHPIGDGLSVTIGKLEIRFGWEEVDQPGPPNNLVEGSRTEGAPVRTRSPRLPTQPIQAVPDLPQPRDGYQPSTVQHPIPGAEPAMRDTGGSGVGPAPVGPPPMLEPPRMGGPPQMNAGPPRMDGRQMFMILAPNKVG